MAQILLESDTKATDFGHLTSIDLELNSVILELVYLSCLLKQYGSAGTLYEYQYGAKIEVVQYQNPIKIFSFFANISKGTAKFILDRTLFYKEEKEKRQAQADLQKAEVEEKNQSVIQKKLSNLEQAHKLRQKLIKDGVLPEEANRLIGHLLVDQRAQLLLQGSDAKS